MFLEVKLCVGWNSKILTRMFLLTGDGAVVRTRHYQPYPTLMTSMMMMMIMPQV